MSHVAVANEIMRHFGGNRSMYMIGGKNPVAHNDKRGALSIRHMKTKVNGKSANYFKVTLNENDLYDLEFGWIHGLNYTVRDTIENVFAEDLRHMFEYTTKLYLSL